MTTEPPKRRLLQFRLRTLLIAILVLSLPLSWFAVRMERARRQRETVKAIERIGGRVEYDYMVDKNGLHIMNAQPPGPVWLRALLGNDFFSDVVTVNLSFICSDSDLACCSSPTTFKRLLLVHAPITDAGLERIAEFTSLQGLSLHGTKITDGGLEYLRRLPELEGLNLQGTSVTDTGLEHLQVLTGLKELSLEGTKVTDAGIVRLRKLPKLELLILDGTEVTDDGLQAIKGLPSLQFLSLANTVITDAGLEHLKGLSNLETLTLVDTNVVTPDGIETLRKSLPNCKMTRQYIVECPRCSDHELADDSS